MTKLNANILRMTDAGDVEDWIKMEFAEFMKIGRYRIGEFVNCNLTDIQLRLRVLIEWKSRDKLPIDAEFQEITIGRGGDHPRLSSTAKLNSIVIVLALHMGLMTIVDVEPFLSQENISMVDPNDFILWKDLDFCNAPPSIQLKYLRIQYWRNGNGLADVCRAELMRSLDIASLPELQNCRHGYCHRCMLSHFRAHHCD
eukprot:CCRYP_016553-RA/>CCRYP_016553-RA protein AED:0.45 eAED:0.45 QI:0/-1/0/1/-1/1/1/0/198